MGIIFIFEITEKHFFELSNFNQASFIFDTLIKLLPEIVKNPVVDVKSVDLLNDFNPILVFKRFPNSFKNLVTNFRIHDTFYVLVYNSSSQTIRSFFWIVMS